MNTDSWLAGALYLRQSEDRTGDSAGVRRQEEDGHKTATARSIRIVAVLCDNDISAAGKRRRPDFDRLINMIDAGECQVVIAWDWTRLTRNRRDELRLIEVCMARNIRIILVRGGELDMSTPAGRTMADMQALIARNEIDVKGDRQRRAIEQAAGEGRRVGGRRPFGFETDGVTLRPAEAAAIIEGAQLVRTGATLAEVARRWNAAGHSTGQIGHRTGELGKWRHDNVRAVLLNPRYAGLRAHKGAVVAEAQWPAIISAEEYASVRSVLTDASRKTGPTSGRRLLTGLALCAVCDATVHAGGAVHRYPTYRCSKADNRIKGHVIRKAEPVEEYVKWLVIEWCMKPEARARIALGAPPDTGLLVAGRTAAAERLERAAAEYSDDVITLEQLRTITRRLRAKIAEFDTKLAAAADTNSLLALVTAEDVEGGWELLTTGQKRTVINALMTVHLRGPGRGIREVRREDVPIDWEPWARETEAAG